MPSNKNKIKTSVRVYKQRCGNSTPPPPNGGAGVKKANGRVYKLYQKKRYSKMTEFALADRREGELCMCYVRAADDTSWFSNQQITEQSKHFREQRKSGKITMSEHNNGKLKLGEKTFYYFVVQHTDEECDSADPIALANGLMVEGFVYWFANQHNRDALYKYIMGIK